MRRERTFVPVPCANEGCTHGWHGGRVKKAFFLIDGRSYCSSCQSAVYMTRESEWARCDNGRCMKFYAPERKACPHCGCTKRYQPQEADVGRIK
jgi:hypothetical protein